MIGNEINLEYEGKSVEVLVEGRSRQNSAMYTGGQGSINL